MIEGWLDFVAAHPQEFTIQYPPRREYFQDHFLTQPITGLFDNCQELLLYLHIPFCEAKCFYCNFAVDVNNNEKIWSEYTELLLAEINFHDFIFAQDKKIIGVDIGGGTPTLLPTHLLVEILEKIAPLRNYDLHPFPISIETTPKIASEDLSKMQAIKSAGVDRISMGIQSFNNQQLSAVNRNLQIAKNEIAFTNLRQSGFLRINADLIFGLPQQTVKDWENDLQAILKLNPDSITTYDCLYRGKGRIISKKVEALPSPKLYGEMYDLAYSLLLSHGYYAEYGSVNFSKNPNETGTSAYFEGRLLDGKPYLGFGNYATTMIDNYWYFNVYSRSEYVQKLKNNLTASSVIGDFYDLPIPEMYAKYILYSLNFGIISEERFWQRFQINLTDIFAEELDIAINHGWLYKDGNIWKVGQNNFHNLYYIRSLFYSLQAQKWMITQQLNNC